MAEERAAILMMRSLEAPLERWPQWPQYDGALETLARSDSVDLFLKLAPEDRAGIATVTFEELFAPSLDDGSNSIETLLAIDWSMRLTYATALEGHDASGYCVARSACCAAVALLLVLEARIAQSRSDVLDPWSGLLLLRAVDAAQRGDAALSWHGFLESEEGRVSFEEDADRRGIGTELKESEWYRTSYPARRRDELTRSRWNQLNGLELYRAVAVDLAAKVIKASNRARSSAGARALHARTNALRKRAEAFYRQGRAQRNFTSVIEAAAMFIDGLPPSDQLSEKTVQNWLYELVSHEPDLKFSSRTKDR